MAPAPAAMTRSGRLVLCAASGLCLLLGSVHAFSVFLEPLEDRFGAARSAVSLTYSLALVALTLAVLVSDRIVARSTGSRLAVAVCALAALGCLIAARAGTLGGVWIGYSLFFGGANGLGYAFGLQAAARANPGREGWRWGSSPRPMRWGRRSLRRCSRRRCRRAASRRR